MSNDNDLGFDLFDESPNGVGYNTDTFDEFTSNNEQDQYYSQSLTADNNYGEPDELTRPLTFGEYFKMYLWLLIPVAGFIFTIIWAVGGDNVNLNKRNFWRAYWIVYGVVFILCIIITFLFSVLFTLGGGFNA